MTGLACVPVAARTLSPSPFLDCVKANFSFQLGLRAIKLLEFQPAGDLVFLVRVSLPLLLCLPSLLCAGQMPLAAADARDSAFPASVHLVRIGVRFSSDGLRVPIWAVMLGDTARAERIAHAYRALGPHGLNATLWTRAGDAPHWARTTYRRPKNIDEVIAWRDDVRLFTQRQEGDDSLLPAPVAHLDADLIGKMEFIIRYDDGSTKVYLFPGTSAGDAERVVTALTARE